MSTALALPQHMTVAEFMHWEAPFGLHDRRWELVDGEPVCMAPPSVDHGAIQSRTNYLITGHLVATGGRYRVITTPGIIPRAKSDTNLRMPNLGVTCAPIRPEGMLSDPVLLIEIVSPSNEAQARRNVWAYLSIPTVREVLLLSGTTVRAELLRRDADGQWPETPDIITTAEILRLNSIDYEVPLLDLYATSSLGPFASR